ncbi:MAG: hypothetical protein C0394_00100 [Syntrophus sp. (in: bacteria)]|nr:hypothetical protein [Syntrophus sp. (in: bacteria)]
MSDRFDDFLNRLEMPLSEPVIVTVADKVMEVPVVCVRRAGALMQHAMCMIMEAPGRGATS